MKFFLICQDAQEELVSFEPTTFSQKLTLFLPKTNSHSNWLTRPMGGAWERVIRSVRRILNALIQMQTSAEGLITLMTEVKGIFKFQTFSPIDASRFQRGTFNPNICYCQKAFLIYRLAHSPQLAITRAGVGLKFSFLPINSGDVGSLCISKPLRW